MCARGGPASCKCTGRVWRTAEDSNPISSQQNRGVSHLHQDKTLTCDGNSHTHKRPLLFQLYLYLHSSSSSSFAQLIILYPSKTMSVDSSLDRRKDSQTDTGNGNDNGVVRPSLSPVSTHRLRLNPNTDHKPDSYDDLQLGFSPLLFSSLERYLPPSMLNMPRDAKVQYLTDILLRYSPEGERTRVSASPSLPL